MYLLTWNNEAGSLRLIGPFANKEEASAWANANNPHDNPCWQTYNCNPSKLASWYAVPVHSPETAMPIEA